MAIPALLAALARGAAGAGSSGVAAQAQAAAQARKMAEMSARAAKAGNAPDAAKRAAKADEAKAVAAERARDKTSRLANSINQYEQTANNAIAQTFFLKGAISGLSSKLVGSLTTAASFVKTLADPVAQLVGLARPAAVQQFTLAFNDAMAVIGRGMLPILQAFTRAMRGVGNTYARLEPVINSVSQHVAAAIDKVFGELSKVWAESGPAIELLAEAFKVVVSGAVKVYLAFMRVGQIFLRVWNQIARVLGFRGDSLKQNASSFGASTRDVKYVSSAEDVSRDVTTRALAQILNAGKKPDTELDALKGIDGLIQQVLEFLRQFPTKEDIKNFLAGLVDAIVPGGRETVESGGRAGRGFFDGAGGILASSINDLAKELRSNLTR